MTAEEQKENPPNPAPEQTDELLLQLQQELKECKEKNLRLLAEMENARKRMQKEKTETMRFVIEDTCLEFLPILDNFENALKFAGGASPEIKSWAEGFQMILTQFKEALQNHGIIAFHAEKGSHFDPHHHEAMEIVEGANMPDNTILEEFAKGYKSSQRTIRPVKVKVAKQVIPIEEKENHNDSNQE